MRKHRLIQFVSLCMCLTASVAANASEPPVKINTDFPGGNLVVTSHIVDVVHVAPDLRGGRDWFYWCFEATAKQAGEVTFQFPEKVAQFRLGAVGFQGPAVSSDGGKTWDWKGSNADFTSADHFTWTFKKVGETVRFASTIPYTRANFDEFVRRHKDNEHLRVSQLTKTRKGRDVPLVQVGEPGEDRVAVLMTCRHHANEAIASFLLEGILSTAISNSDDGRAFRKSFVLYAVPLVDADGVELGDQGKGRVPHDHNRDYGDNSIYRSVQAIKILGVEKKVSALLDLHCPTLVMDIHQRFYFAGPNDTPPKNETRVQRFAELLKAELPDDAPYGPVLQLRPTDKDRHKHCSGYFAALPGIMMATTLEVPFAPKKTKMSPSDVRSYGASLLRAWNQLGLKE